MAESGLEKKLKGYNESVVVGQGVGLASTYAGISNVDKVAKYIPGIDSLLNYNLNFFGKSFNLGLPVIGAALNFIGGQVGFAASLYAYNREKYKGMKGKLKFLKDNYNLGIRHLGGYAITYPLAIGASALALGTGLFTGAMAVTFPYIIESVITGLGYLFSTKRYRKTAYAPS